MDEGPTDCQLLRLTGRTRLAAIDSVIHSGRTTGVGFLQSHKLGQQNGPQNNVANESSHSRGARNE